MDWNDFLMTTYTIVLPVILGYIVWLLQSSKKKEYKRQAEDEERHRVEDAKAKAQSKGIMLVLRYMLSRYHTEYMFQKYVTSEQLSDFEEIFQAYEALGGNSVAVKWRDEVVKLPVNDNTGNNLSPIAKVLLKSEAEEKGKQKNI